MLESRIFIDVILMNFEILPDIIFLIVFYISLIYFQLFRIVLYRFYNFSQHKTSLSIKFYQILFKIMKVLFQLLLEIGNVQNSFKIKMQQSRISVFIAVFYKHLVSKMRL